MKKIAILSNVNVDPIVQGLRNDFEVFQNEGYGNEIEMLMNPHSALRQFQPEAIYLFVDILEFMNHNWDVELVSDRIHQWYAALESSLQQDCVYFVSDICMRGRESRIYAKAQEELLILQCWQESLEHLMAVHSSVYPFAYRRIMLQLGEAAYSEKMWYLGKIIHSRQAMEALGNEIRHTMDVMTRVPKKLLLLDLDNTLWGGLAGECDHHPVELSEEKKGMVYKDLQRVIYAMKSMGVMLGIVSKNNAQDAMGVIAHHPHMVLHEEDFVAMKINWNPKSENIRAIAEELNIGLDSIVFFDDNELEREEIRSLLPEVTVPDFPKQTEKLVAAMEQIYQDYFEKISVTAEDGHKTEQYLQESQRRQWREEHYATDYRGYLQSLQIQVYQENAVQNIDRILQLLNKTNQFNLTTHRYEMPELLEQMQQGKKNYYAFRVTDRFGDAGIVGIIGVSDQENTVTIDDFVMSCRIMGRQIEACMLDLVETELEAEGKETVYASYRQTAKNQPVANFYDEMGYQILDQTEEGVKKYSLSLRHRPDREYCVSGVKMLSGR